jgi:hypothetical protein
MEAPFQKPLEAPYHEPNNLKLVGILFKNYNKNSGCTSHWTVPIQQYRGMSVNVNVLLVVILGVQGLLIMQFGGSFLLAGILPSC